MWTYALFLFFLVFKTLSLNMRPQMPNCSPGQYIGLQSGRVLTQPVRQFEKHKLHFFFSSFDYLSNSIIYKRMYMNVHFLKYKLAFFLFLVVFVFKKN